MLVLQFRNVNEALPVGLKLLQRDGIDEPSRAGPVRVLPYPVTTVYERPMERVLFWPARDANPFFHLFESIWMLAGRRDLDFPKRFNKRFSDFSDDGLILHGAYGYRWRHTFSLDQLATIISMLRDDPNTRRAVLQMWSATSDLGMNWKDLPCNTTIYFRVRRPENRLDMTVCCRSNDIIWGAYGANAVHMSMLHEYIALAIGRDVGFCYQVSNDYHAYYSVFEPLHLQMLKEAEEPIRVRRDQYDVVTPMKLIQFDEKIMDFDRDCLLFVDSPHSYGFNTKFFSRTVQPMFSAWCCYEEREYDKALKVMKQVEAEDWGLAGSEWLARRASKARAKAKAGIQKEMKL